MKYKDYYQALGVERTATTDDIKKAYRKLAHQYHPDISKDPKGEEKFKEVAEAYATLKNTEKRQEYDNLGARSTGDNFTPPPEWQQQYGAGASAFDDVDISDLFNAFRSSRGGNGRGHASYPVRGEDYEVPVAVSLEKIYRGGETDVSVELPEYDAHGLPHRVTHTFRITIPKGAADGQRMRLGGKGGPGRDGGKPGDLYVVLTIAAHPLFRVSGRDLYLDLSLTPWEAVLGTAVEVPTLGGEVELKIKPGTLFGQQLRLAGRGLPSPDGGSGDLYAVVQIVTPKNVSKAEQELYEQLATASGFNPRVHMKKGTK
ncbi:MAG: DnaJ C-terminal domain-containing protein [Burkholderiaceae bacterium]